MSPARRRAAGGRARRGTVERRRSGPPGEERWWEPADQAVAEAELLDRRVLGRGWQDTPMVNNEERADPLGDDPDSEVVRAARRARRRTALDEGRAWRHRDHGLVVLRSEVFAGPDDAGHRAAWRAHGERSLDATWRQRWRERDVTPGWIESRLVPPAERPDPLHAFVEAVPTGVAADVDWIRIEDHTDPSGAGLVTMYEHLTVWADRAHVVVIVRHDSGLDLDDVATRAAVAAHERVAAALP